MKSRHLSIGKETAPRWRSLRVLQVREGTFEWKMPDAGLFPASPSYKLDLKFFLYVMFLVKSLPAPNCLQMSLGCKLFCQKFLCSPGGFRSLAFQLFFSCVSLNKGCACEGWCIYLEVRELRSGISVPPLCVHARVWTQILRLVQQVLELPRPFYNVQFEIDFNETKINEKS